MFPPLSSHIHGRRRLALTAVTATAVWPDEAFTTALRQASSEEQETFATYLATQGLAGHWLARLRRDSAVDELNFCATLRRWEKAEAMRYLAQRRAIAIAEERLSKSGIPYALMKGAHVRELLYENPAIRPAVDVDILIAPQDRFRAVEIFGKAGFALQINPATVSHEVSLADKITNIDLHWDILRPGRAHASLAREILERREPCQSFSALRPQDELFLLLFHPVFTKYLTTPHARLTNIVDLFYWGQTLAIDWQELGRLCVRHHFTTAAWLTASHLRLLTSSQVFDDFIALMRPGVMKAGWLDHWLREDYSSRFLNRPWLIQLLFTLPAHDHCRDVLRFLGVWGNERRKTKAECRRLKQATEAVGNQ